MVKTSVGFDHKTHILSSQMIKSVLKRKGGRDPELHLHLSQRCFGVRCRKWF